NPGPPGSDHRRRFLVRLAAHVTRTVAAASGKRIAVRARPGPEPDQVVVAFPWRRRSAAEALGRELVDVLGSLLSSRVHPARVIEGAARRLQKEQPGPSPSVPEPAIPVVMVTGTNGKTSTVRLIAHIARVAGLQVSYSSTDGVYFN